jgi:hypothetical protein
MSLVSGAQDGNRFKVAVGTGFGGYPILGPLFFLEPSYQPNKLLMISARIEGIIGPDLSESGTTGVGSYGIQVARFFTGDQEPFKPFFGLGIHRYHLGTGMGMMNDASSSVTPQMGLNPRLGFHFRHLFMSVEYNYILPVTRTSYSIIPSPNPPVIYTETLHFNYLCVKIGVLLHAGKQQ